MHTCKHCIHLRRDTFFYLAFVCFVIRSIVGKCLKCSLKGKMQITYSTLWVDEDLRRNFYFCRSVLNGFSLSHAYIYFLPSSPHSSVYLKNRQKIFCSLLFLFKWRKVMFISGFWMDLHVLKKLSWAQSCYFCKKALLIPWQKPRITR